MAYEEILGVNLSMFGKVEVFLGHEHSLTEEILVDLLAISFWDEPEDMGQRESSFSIGDWRHTLSRVPGALRGIAYNVVVRLIVGLFVKKKYEALRRELRC